MGKGGQCAHRVRGDRRGDGNRLAATTSMDALLPGGVERVTTSCATLEANLPAHPPADLDREFVAAVDEYVKALSGDPATPAAPWRVDTDALLAANTGVRTAAALLTDADGAERVLVAEIATITAVVTEVAASDIEVG